MFGLLQRYNRTNSSIMNSGKPNATPIFRHTCLGDYVTDRAAPKRSECAIRAPRNSLQFRGIFRGVFCKTEFSRSLRKTC